MFPAAVDGVALSCVRSPYMVICCSQERCRQHNIPTVRVGNNVESYCTIRVFLFGCVICDPELDNFIQRMLVYLLRHEHVIKHMTEESCFEIVQWSLNIMSEGVFPATGPDGELWPRNSWRASQAGRPLTAGHHCGILELSSNVGCRQDIISVGYHL